ATPTRCVSRSRIVTGRVTYGSWSSNAGRRRRTGSSQSSTPSSTSMPSAATVNALVVDAIAHSVCSSTDASRPYSRTPYPRAKITESSRTMAMASPGTSQALRACSMYASRSASGSAARTDAAGAADCAHAGEAGAAKTRRRNESLRRRSMVSTGRRVVSSRPGAPADPVGRGIYAFGLDNAPGVPAPSPRQLVQDHGELLERERTLHAHAVDEERRRGAHAALRRERVARHHAQVRAVFPVAGAEPLRIESRVRGVPAEQRLRISRTLPFPLPRVEQVVHRPERRLALLGRALGRARGLPTVRERAQDELHGAPAHPAGLDVLAVQHGVGLRREQGTVRAAEVTELDHRDRR